jgi:hypothetical protein
VPPGSVDRILIVNTWHHLPDRRQYSRALRTALAPGGFVLVVDFDEQSPIGPPAHVRLSAARVIDELREGGLEAELSSETLPYQYVIVGRRPASDQLPSDR